MHTCPNCGYCPHCGRSDEKPKPPTIRPLVPSPETSPFPRPWMGGGTSTTPQWLRDHVVTNCVQNAVRAANTACMAATV